MDLNFIHLYTIQFLILILIGEFGNFLRESACIQRSRGLILTFIADDVVQYRAFDLRIQSKLSFFT